MKNKSGKKTAADRINKAVAKEENKENSRLLFFFRIIFVCTALASLALGGGYFEYVSCLALFVFLLLLGVSFFVKSGNIRKSGVKISVTVMGFMYLAVCLWAVDRGMAFIGFMKYLPFVVFIFLLDILKVKREVLIRFLPLVGCASAVLSAILSKIPSMKSFCVVNGRLAGPFEYPNTFAIFLLVCLIVCSYGRNVLSLIYAAVLLAGIYKTGSLTVFILTGACFLLFPVVHKDIRKKLLAAYVPLILIAAAVFIFGGKISGMDLKSSTFTGRLLYYADSIKLIIRHPFGLGHMGYYYSVGTVQTGVYSLRYVHNGFLQMVLDVGILPAAFFFFEYIKSAVKAEDKRNTFVLAVLLAHILFDYDLSFISVWFVMGLFLEEDAEKTENEAAPELKKQKSGSGKGRKAAKNVQSGNGLIIKICVLCASVILMVLSVTVGLSCFCYKQNKYSEAVDFYPGNTEARLYLLTYTEDRSEKMKLAEDIIKGNKYADYAYKVLADCEFKEGDMDAYLTHMQKAIDLSPYTGDYYLNYFDTLYAATEYFAEQGQADNAKYCYEKLSKIPLMLVRLEGRTSALGSRIRDIPMTKLPEDYTERLNTLGKKLGI